MTKGGKEPDNTGKEAKKPIKRDARKKEQKRSKLQIDIDDDKIIEFHFQKLSYREIGKKLKLSHATIKQRIDSILKKIKTTDDKDFDSKRIFIIREHEAVKKKAWQIINLTGKNADKLKFKYLEVIIKANQEIAKLYGSYPKENLKDLDKEKPKTFEELMKSMNSERDIYKDSEEDSQEES